MSTPARIGIVVVSVALPAVVVIGIAVAGLTMRSGQEQAFALNGVPDEVLHNYHYVESQPILAAHIPCYCGCVADGHRSLLDCYVRPGGGYEPHASGCGICGMEADLVEQLHSDGAEPHTIRIAIDREFGSFGKPTNTP